MNMCEMVVEIAGRSGLPRQQAEAAVASLLGIIAESLGRGEKVTLAGFGTFKVVERRERAGRNPRSGRAIRIPGTRVPRFVVSESFRVPGRGE
jgi:DNA-binding protein HU-beta